MTFDAVFYEGLQGEYNEREHFFFFSSFPLWYSGQATPILAESILIFMMEGLQRLCGW